MAKCWCLKVCDIKFLFWFQNFTHISPAIITAPPRHPALFCYFILLVVYSFGHKMNMANSSKRKRNLLHFYSIFRKFYTSVCSAPYRAVWMIAPRPSVTMMEVMPELLVLVFFPFQFLPFVHPSINSFTQSLAHSFVRPFIHIRLFVV